jgi:large subunit ribosomal protein L19
MPEATCYNKREINQMDAILLREITADQIKSDLPEFGPGDTLRIHVRVVEGEKERVQIFEGDVLQRKGSGVHATFTVRKVTQGIAVERIFPLHSPRIAKIERTRQGRVRRARLFYLRDRKGRAARIREKR